MAVKTYQNFLSIRRDGKGIPYGGLGEPRADGSANFGFQDLKGKPEAIETVPELKKDADLKSAVAAINRRDTGLFSVGCESGDVSEQQGFRRSGYIEFAINSKSRVQDAANYFPIFFHFDRLLENSKFNHPVQFNWELQGAAFIDSNTTGYTCAVFVNTQFCADSNVAGQAWSAALAALAQLLSAVPPFDGEPIY